MRKYQAALIAIGAVAASAVIGGRSGPTPTHPRTALWYALLRKPEATPPGPLIGAVWMALDVLLGYSGYRLMTARRGPDRRIALGAWIISVTGVAAHSLAFFGRRSTLGGLMVAGTMTASSAVCAAAAARTDRRAALASLPLVAWTACATVLNEELWRRN